ncbi:MAG: hypothetical protein A2428_02340 [Bdellovibrionales bacterium RIFOXYC1_FULL_54_43]|nr:MAG: hypothetical protein A2428_02340 [Bdellovibrionales bacterium RIFOXYC1_FULL_54_43]OFZ84690.1 MAG: hypothetical protein A2603_13805 [Bdellovibrionales bacterium RIFOXYD1_FULL_55_31]
MNSPIWNWEIAVYLFLGGMSAGLMILSCIRSGHSSPERLLPFLSVLILSVGMAALFMDLAFKTHVYRFYLAFQWKSPMSWGSWILLGIYPAALLFGLTRVEEAEIARLTPAPLLGTIHSARRWAISQERVLKQTNLFLGIALGVYTGILLSSLGRPAWNSAVLGPLFLVSGFSAGAAILTLFTEENNLHRWEMHAISAEFALILLYIFGLTRIGNPDGSTPADLFLGGRFTAIFWVFTVMIGLCLPFVLGRILRPPVGNYRFLGASFVLIGSFSLRWIIVTAGQS